MQGTTIVKQKTAKPVIGGVLILLGGLGSLVVGVVLYIGISQDMLGIDITGWVSSLAESLLQIFGVLLIILGLIAIVGGIFAIKREKFGLAIVSGVLTIYTLLSLIGLILVALSKDEFA